MDRPLCYLWGCGLRVSRTPGAVQAPSSVGGGRRAGAARPGPAGAAAPLAGAADHPLPRWAGDGGWRRGSARRAARPPSPAQPGPPPARPGAPGDGRRRGTPAPPLPSAQGPAAALCRCWRAGGGRGGGDRGGGGGGGGRRCCWPAARPGIHPTAGRGPGLTLSSANESVQPGFRSDSLLNMKNRQEYAKQYAEHVKEYADYARCYAEYLESALKYAEYAWKYVK
jgi:hypothetical protein